MILDNSGGLKVALYIRVSTEDQAKEGFSLPAQLSRLRDFSRARQWEVIGEYVDDGYSGRNTKRPGYQKMFKEIKNWDGLLVIKMDRIHRNSKNFMNMMDQLNKEEKEFISMSESLDTSSAMGRFVMNIIQAIAELESGQIGERTYGGMKQKAKQPMAGDNGGKTPFGYKKIYKQIGKDTISEIIEVPENLEIVKKMYELAENGMSINKIAQALGVNYSKAHTVLHNPFYAGLQRWMNDLSKPTVEAIIDPKTWNKIQRKISKRNCKPGVRTTPLQLPVDGRDQFTLSKEEYLNISSVRNLGSKKPRHELAY